MTFCVLKTKQNGLSCQKWLRHSWTQPILTANFWTPFNRFVQNRETVPSDPADVTLERQTNAIFGVAFVLLSGTRAACFPRIDADATDVYRFPWTGDRTRVEFELSQEITTFLKFSRKWRSPWFWCLTNFDHQPKGSVTLVWIVFQNENSNKISTLIKWHLANLVLRNGFYTIVFEI